MIDIRQVLDHYNIYYEEKKNSDELYFLCPFHDDQNLGSAFFNETTGEWICFSCSNGGNSYKFVMDMEQCDFPTAKKLIDSDFDDKTYDVQKLSVKFERAEKRLQKKPRSRTAQTIIHKFLDAFSQRNPPLDFMKKWYKICVYLMYQSSQDSKDFDKECLQFYTQFFQELNSGVI